jgi:hypothetical protein
MFLSSRFDASHRGAYARELAAHIGIDSYGAFLRNRALAGDRDRPSKLATIARYPFTIAFENSIADDCVTEKSFDPRFRRPSGHTPVPGGARRADASLRPRPPQRLTKTSTRSGLGLFTAELSVNRVKVVGVAVKVCVGASGVKLGRRVSPLVHVAVVVIELPCTAIDPELAIENWLFTESMQLPAMTRVPPMGVLGQPASL